MGAPRISNQLKVRQRAGLVLQGLHVAQRDGLSAGRPVPLLPVAGSGVTRDPWNAERLLAW